MQSSLDFFFEMVPEKAVRDQRVKIGLINSCYEPVTVYKVNDLIKVLQKALVKTSTSCRFASS